MRHVATRVSGFHPQGRNHASGQDAEETEEHPVNGSDEGRLESLYEQIAWPLAEKYGHPYDAFKLALT